MPYRRLPNTDQARIRALKAVVVKGDICNVYDLAVSLKALTDARNLDKNAGITSGKGRNDAK